MQVSLALALTGFVVSAEADPASAVRIANRHRPALIIIAAPIPDRISGVLRTLASGHPPHLVVILTGSGASSDVIAALRSGARGYLPDTIAPAGLSRALRCVLAGEIALPRHVVTAIVEQMKLDFGDGAGRRLSPLTLRELQVLGLLREGLPNEEIAQRLSIAPATVRSHVSAIRRKLRAPESRRRRGLRRAQSRTAQLPGSISSSQRRPTWPHHTRMWRFLHAPWGPLPFFYSS